MLPFPRPLDLLIVTDGHGKEASRLARLGAAVNAVAYDNAIAVMKYGIRAADAVVIEESRNDLSSMGAMRLANMARAIHELPDPVAMPSGARWKGIPIVALVDHDDVANALHLDLPYVIACATENLFYWDYIDPWPDIYDRIDSAVYENKLARMEEMQRLGFRFQLMGGRYLRLIPPNPRRRNGALQDLETPLYSGLHDVLLRRRRDTEDHWTARRYVDGGGRERARFL